METFIAANTPFANSDAFSAYLTSRGETEKFGGGLTHEISSYMAKADLNATIAAGDHSFIYDSTGSRAIIDTYGPRALANGMHVDIHQMATPIEAAIAHNATRSRSVAPEILQSTHAKVAAIVPIIQEWVRTQKLGGEDVTFRVTRNKGRAHD
jgi:hypothetical protein